MDAQQRTVGRIPNARAAGRVALAIAALAFPGTALAAPGPAVMVKVHQTSGLVSPYFQVAGAPAQSVEAGSLELTNPGASTVTVRLDRVAAMTTNTLGSGYALRAAQLHGPATWLRLSAAMVRIAPHGSESVTVGIDVPGSAKPGEYLSGVAVEALGQRQAATDGSGVAIAEIERYAIGVEVKLPGPRHAGSS